MPEDENMSNVERRTHTPSAFERTVSVAMGHPDAEKRQEAINTVAVQVQEMRDKKLFEVLDEKIKHICDSAPDNLVLQANRIYELSSVAEQQARDLGKDKYPESCYGMVREYLRTEDIRLRLENLEEQIMKPPAEARPETVESWKKMATDLREKLDKREQVFPVQFGVEPNPDAHAGGPGDVYDDDELDALNLPPDQKEEVEHVLLELQAYAEYDEFTKKEYLTKRAQLWPKIQSMRNIPGNYKQSWGQELDGRANSKSSNRSESGDSGNGNDTRELVKSLLNEREARMIDGRESFLNSIYEQSLPDSYKNSPWFRELSPIEQDEINSTVEVIKICQKKKDGQKKGFEGYKESLSFTVEQLNSLISSKGWRIATATLSHDLLKMGNLTPEVNGIKSQGEVPGMILSERGKRILQDKDGIYLRYKAAFINAMAAYFVEHPEHIGFSGELDSTLQTRRSRNTRPLREIIDNAIPVERNAKMVAEAYFGASMAFLSASLAIESADTVREIVLSEPTVVDDSYRTFAHLHAKTRSKVVRGPDKIGTEELHGGRVGVWIRDRAMHSTDFRDNFDKYEEGTRFFPRVMCGSLLDHTYYKNGTTLAEQICNESNKRAITPNMGGVTLYDYANLRALDARGLKDINFGSTYGTLLESQNRLFMFLTADEESKNQIKDLNDFIGAIRALQKKGQEGDKIMAQVHDPQFLEDIFITFMGAQAGGFVQGLDRPILNFDPRKYDELVATYLYDDSLLYLFGVEVGSVEAMKLRKHLFYKLMAHDPTTNEGSKLQTKEFHHNGPRAQYINEHSKLSEKPNPQRRRWFGR